ncbi:dihydrolipoyl dehydrogenase [Vibrio viridaestus]|uniref:Dihydrolipoyl dehydrogenase n=1 Tax=Vibrio viridaestus TaxID=2487322 RepID=A0A3N9U0K5_9VIBR|nr:dihydrolipoyl dehydrogenase [Vibrio viridaestus]RQW62772.1 dihydrolipoyl dehydrogenase [Vibrio viridaestus]
MKTDLLVIGGGPAGHVAAIKAVEYGKKAIVIEKYKLGGTCLHQGCIPTKTLLHTTELYDELKHCEQIGLHVENAFVDLQGLQRRKNEIIDNITSGVSSLVEKKGVDVVYGLAELISLNRAKVTLSDGSEEYIDFDNLILATGSEPFMLNIPGADLPSVITSNEALSFTELPKKLVIVGGGVIGVEFAQMLNRLGVKVSIIEAYHKLLPHMDNELTQQLTDILRSEGIDIYLNAVVESFESHKEDTMVYFKQDGIRKALDASTILMAVGRKPNTNHLNLESLGIELERGAIKVNRFMQTNIPHIYAVGDCTGGFMLAHVGFEQAVIAAKNITSGNQEQFDGKTVPACVYTKPEFACVGLSEEKARHMFDNIKVGTASLAGNAKTVIGQQTGYVKFVVDGDSSEVLGLHILGPRASDMIHEGALALKMNAKIEDILETIHGHPTVAEGVHEAAQDIFKNAIYKLYD